MAKKTPPRRHPATQADVERAKAQARTDGIGAAMAIFFAVLFDKHGATKEDLAVFWAEVNELSDSIAQGYVSLADLRRALDREYDIKI